MTLTERIFEHARDLPESLQEEILDFIEYLESKAERNKIGRSERDWSDFSLTSAMRGMEDESSPYTSDDIKERFA